MDKIKQLQYLKECYLYHSERFEFSKKYIKKVIKQIDAQIKEEQHKCI